jgi:septum formation protein
MSLTSTGASVLPLTLASQSVIRGQILRQAGLSFTQMHPGIDEELAKASLRAEGATPREQADALAELKAVAASRRQPGLVIGADQILDLDGQSFDKPDGLDGLRRHLRLLSGRTHRLHSAVVIAQDGAPVWRALENPRLTMRTLSPEFIETYVAACGEAALTSVGGYQLEKLGAHLFTRIEGDYFSILGLPLLAVLGYLRERGLVA